MIEHSCSRARATQNATVSRIQWGEVDICFVEGRSRFGAVLCFPGFHYDVRPARGLLDCTLYDCRGVARDLGPERREYINIFPNDHLLPERR